jgi:CheY-like chemotaxis protein/nitrogen-specific signal transduction histidine kinase
MLTDVTARRQLQEQLNQAQKMQAVGRLAGGVAHDFNNLLTIVTGYGQMLQESFPQDDERWECARAILNAAERSARLTRQLLNLSRQELPSPSVTHVNTVIGELNSMLRRVLGEEVVLTEMLRPDLWNSRIHRAQIEQILLNLIVNARDAMPKGGTILLETDSLQLNETDLEQHPALRPGRYVMIGVSDTGSGMDEQLMAHLFEPFFTTKSRDQGAGLGLSVVYGIVQQAGGEIQVDSVPGVGSTFRVYLPATESDVTEEAPAPVAAQPAREGETILLVEDDPEVLALVRTRLTSLNYAVLEASSAQEAVHLVENHPDRIHLLLTDVVMPKTKGPDLARELLVRRPHIRVIYMSGYPDHSAVTEDLAKPGFRFLPKPFTREDLARVIRESLDGPSPQASVLIADDDADVRATFRLVLRGGGYAVDEADSGRAAMQRLSERHFDLLLTDLVMPDYNGIELIRMVRQKYPSLKVIATSGALSEMLGVASYLGADAALPKPIRPETLLSTLAKVLG